MPDSNNNYIGCPVLIYDIDGQHLVTDTVAAYDKTEQHMRTENDLLPLLKVGVECKLLILAQTVPREFYGRIVQNGKEYYFALYKGRNKEDRKSERYSATTPIVIHAYICDGTSYTLSKPLAGTLINISRSGLRFKSSFYTLLDGDIFQFSMKVGNMNKTFVAVVINHLDNEENGISEYGCQFITNGKGGGNYS